MWQLLLADGHWSAVVDVGANYGEMLLGVGLPPAAKVVAIEPNPRVLAALRRSIEESLPGAEVVPAAIGVHEGSAVLHDDMTWWGNSTLCHSWTRDRPNHAWREQTVAAVTLDSIIAGLGLEPLASVAVKLDIEGMEASVLRQSLPALLALGRVAVMLEVVRLHKLDLDWLLKMFTVFVLDRERSELERFAGSQADDLLSVLEAPRSYRRDVVAVPRGPSAGHI